MLFVTKQFKLYDDAHLGYEYEISCSGGIKHRGPPVNLEEPYVCCVGNSGTFGRFVTEPYPQILSGLLNVPVLNLGYCHLTPNRLTGHLLKIINGAIFRILQFHQIHVLDTINSPLVWLAFKKVAQDGCITIQHTAIKRFYPDQDSHFRAATELAEVLHDTLSYSGG